MPRIRPAVVADLPACRDIYAHHVRHGVGTFEEVPPDADEFAGRFAAVVDAGLPWLIAEGGGEGGAGPGSGVIGFAYAGAYLTRSAYRFTVQDSIYVAPDAVGGGVGRSLLTAVIDRCAELGFRRMVALIGGAENAGSRGLHRACGFVEAGILPGVGFKFGAWRDVVLMHRPLGSGADDAPAQNPAARVPGLR